MKPERSLRKIISPIIAIITAIFFLSASVCAQDFFVWKRTSPCRDSRQDWFAVAKTFPGFGFDAGSVDGPLTFTAAMASADAFKMGADFRNYCCSDWNVLRNNQTGRFAVSKQVTSGFEVFRGGLCCEEAMDLAGFAVESVNDCRNLRLSTGAVVTRQPNGSFIPFVAPTVTGGITGGTGEAVWFVWKLTSPCRDSRQDWFAVAKTFPGFGFDASSFDGPLTFTAAMASADAFKMGADFRNYCCPWNVYRNNQTGAFSVGKQSFVSPGPNLELFRGGICCEEAFALAGFAIGNDCRNLRLSTGAIVSIQSNGTFATVASPTAGINPIIQATLANTKCWPGSYAAWNQQTQKVECYCNTGYVWNSAKNACVDPQELTKNADCSGYKGSYAAWNAQNNRVECWCPQGTKWNDSKTACISDAEWAIANTKCWPGSYAAWNAQAQRIECYCNTGLVWNSARNACIDPQELVKNANCSGYPGSYAAWNVQTNRVECWCPPGKTWNETKTACIDNASQVNCWPGSYAAFNPQTNRTECFCNPGLVWNSTNTACVQPQTPGDKHIVDIVVTQQNVTISVWDHGCEDGDIINLLINGQVYLSNHTLTNTKKEFNVTLSSGKNYLEIVAVDSGTDCPPQQDRTKTRNSAAIHITNAISGGDQSWELGMGARTGANFTVRQ